MNYGVNYELVVNYGLVANMNYGCELNYGFNYELWLRTMIVNLLCYG